MKHFMATIEARISDPYTETVKRGNVWFSAASLTQVVLEKAKARFCESSSNTILKYHPHQAYITFVCEIQE